MTMNGKPLLYATYTDFATRGRRELLRRHTDPGTAERYRNRWDKVYGTQAGYAMWTERIATGERVSPC